MSDAFIISRGGGAIKSIKDAVIELDRDSWTYDGGSHAPAVKRVTLRGAELVEWRDYVCVSNPATAAGEYEVAVLGVAAYGGAAHAPWRIEKAAGSISAQPSSVSIQGMAGTTTAVTLTIVGDGAVRVGESELVSGSVEGTKLTLTSVSEGTGTVQIILDEGQNYTGASCEVSVSVMFVSRVLENNTWEVIAQIAASGKANSIWMVGDTKNVTIGMPLKERPMVIIGFNEDILSSSDDKYNDPNYNNGQNKAAITFQSKDCAYSDVFYGTVNTQSFGWFNSPIRTDAIPSYKYNIPEQFLSNLRKVSIKSYIYSSSAYNNNYTARTSSDDDLFILSRSDTISVTNLESEQYEYYKKGNSPKKLSDDSSGYTPYLTRDFAYDSYNICVWGIDTDGSAKKLETRFDQQYPIAFCI